MNCNPTPPAARIRPDTYLGFFELSTSGALTFNAVSSRPSLPNPTNMASVTGSSVTFAVSTTGSGLTYQWNKNGAAIAGATASSLTLTNVSAGDQAAYTVTVSVASGGSQTSSAATLKLIFSYANRDLLLGFRKTGGDGVGTVSVNDLEVNIGQASLYYNATPGSTFTVSQYSMAQIAADFDNLNDLNWSVAGFVPQGDGGDPGKPAKTLWVTAPRATLRPTPASPLLDFSASAQGSTGSKIGSALLNAAFYAGTTAAVANANNSATAVTVPVGNANSEAAELGANGDFLATFEGDVENTTPPNFVTGGTVSRSDLYELQPDTTGGTHPAGTYLGYFELSTSGTLTFNAYLAPITSQPVSMTGGTGDSVTFTVGATGSGLAYQWSQNGSAISGATGSSLTLNGVTSANAGSYTVLVSNSTGSETSTAGILTVDNHFAYTNRDLLLGFRKTGSDGTGTIGTNDLEVDIGQASLYYGATPGSTFTVSQYSTAQIAADFDSLNDLNWSVAELCAAERWWRSEQAGQDPVGHGAAHRAGRRPPPRCWTTAPVRRSTTGSKIGSALLNAVFYANTAAGLANANNSATSWFPYPPANADSEAAELGANGDFVATFESDVENTTPANFVTGGSVSRSDLYELQPDTTGGTHPAGKYLGYFELGTSGTLAFNAFLPPITSQPVNMIGGMGDSTTFTVSATGSGLTYQWSQNGTAIAGATNGSLTLTSLSSANAGGYTVQVSNSTGTQTEFGGSPDGGQSLCLHQPRPAAGLPQDRQRRHGHGGHQRPGSGHRPGLALLQCDAGQHVHREPMHRTAQDCSRARQSQRPGTGPWRGLSPWVTAAIQASRPRPCGRPRRAPCRPPPPRRCWTSAPARRAPPARKSTAPCSTRCSTPTRPRPLPTPTTPPRWCPYRRATRIPKRPNWERTGTSWPPLKATWRTPRRSPNFVTGGSVSRSGPSHMNWPPGTPPAARTRPGSISAILNWAPAVRLTFYRLPAAHHPASRWPRPPTAVMSAAMSPSR